MIRIVIGIPIEIGIEIGSEIGSEIGIAMGIEMLECNRGCPGSGGRARRSHCHCVGARRWVSSLCPLLHIWECGLSFKRTVGFKLAGNFCAKIEIAPSSCACMCRYNSKYF